MHSELNPINLADVLYNIAFCYSKMGESKEAVDYATEGLKIYRECLPSNHDYILKTEELLRSIEGGKMI